MKTAVIGRVQCSKCGVWMTRIATNSLRSDNQPPFLCIAHLQDARDVNRAFKNKATESEESKDGEEHDA